MATSTSRASPGSSRPAITGSERSTIAVSPARWQAKMRSFAPRYSSKLRWRSRWSGVAFRSSAHSGAKSVESSSWKLDASQMTVASASRSPTSEASGVPTLPATATGSPATRHTWPSSSATVVLPLVPVTATKRLGSSRQASSSSPMTGTPRVSARLTAGDSRGTPGLLTTQCARSTSSSRSPFRFTSTPASRNLSAPSGAPASAPITSSPRSARSRAAACPERARPTTRNGPSGRGGLGWCEATCLGSPCAGGTLRGRDNLAACSRRSTPSAPARRPRPSGRSGPTPRAGPSGTSSSSRASSTASSRSGPAPPSSSSAAAR